MIFNFFIDNRQSIDYDIEGLFPLYAAAESGCDDIVDILRTSKEKYDLFISLDVFIYLGELSIIFNAVRNCSYNDAIFIFSIELQEDKEYSLLKSGRYSHSEEYILKTASNGFKLIEHYDIRLRKEKKGWINGKIFVLQVI